jgi:uncharacterized protein YecE (DUF72 family)
MLDLKVRASFAEILESANEDLGAALRANIRAVRARPQDEFEPKFVRKKNKKLSEQVVPRNILNAIRRLARRPETRDQVSIFKLQGSGGPSQFVDVLHEQFTTEKIIQAALDSLGTVDTPSMYSAIEEAYGEAQGQLLKSQVIE